ncbi:MAG: tetratricopeptide repeat protein [Deltaproteobacteria bacterium]|nr:tetratricopeptide repeat protein [Deltaproteobacteria bacterium]
MAQDEQEAGTGGPQERLAELTRQVVETRNQVIKTGNGLGLLATEVREIGRLHQRQNRALTINSVGAYLIFAVIISLGFYLTHRSRIERVEFEKDVLAREYAAVQSRLEELRQAHELRRKTEAQAAALYHLIDAGEIHKAIERYGEVARLPLSRVEATVLGELLKRRRERLAYGAYTAGMAAIGEKHYKRAVTEFRRSLALLKDPPHAASLLYYLGIALTKLGSFQEAADELERAIRADAEKLVAREVRFYLASAFEQADQREKARAAYQEYARRNPAGALAARARRRIKELSAPVGGAN